MFLHVAELAPAAPGHTSVTLSPAVSICPDGNHWYNLEIVTVSIHDTLLQGFVIVWSRSWLAGGQVLALVRSVKGEAAARSLEPVLHA